MPCEELEDASNFSDLLPCFPIASSASALSSSSTSTNTSSASSNHCSKPTIFLSRIKSTKKFCAVHLEKVLLASDSPEELYDSARNKLVLHPYPPALSFPPCRAVLPRKLRPLLPLPVAVDSSLEGHQPQRRAPYLDRMVTATA